MATMPAAHALNETLVRVPRLRSSRLTAGVVLAGLVLGLVAEHAGNSWLGPAWIPIADLAVGWLMIGCGLLGAAARPRQAAGNRLVLAGFLWFVGTFMGADEPVTRTIGFAFGGYHDLALAWLALSFPNTRPASRFASAVLAVAAVLYVGQTIARIGLSGAISFGMTSIDPDVALRAVLWLDVVRAASIVVAGVLMTIRIFRARAPERTYVWQVLAAGAAAAVAAGSGARYAMEELGFIPDLGEGVTVPLSWAFNVLRIAVPLVILSGVLRVRAARSAIAGAVTEVGDSPSAAALRSALATALGDPGLRVLTWDRGIGRFVDSAEGEVSERDLAALEADPSIAVVHVDGDDGPLAIIVAARFLTDDPSLLDAGVALTRLVVRNEEQSVRIQQQLAEVRASRVRIVEAADVERRRIERDLHDGLQQRMVALAMQLRTAENDPVARAEALRAGSAEVLGLLDEVRELARGIHPAVLTEAGLGAAIRAAADRSPVPAEVDLELSGRGSPAAQATAYYVVSEALANAAKHAAGATAVWVRVADDEGSLRVSVEDDGPGGADAGGHGLAGLADRVAALDGRFAVEARPGGGTRVVAEIPIR
jgi:signal transduction histidine kinase